MPDMNSSFDNAPFFSLSSLKLSLPAVSISETGIRVSCGGEEFLAKGKTVLNPGWKEFEDHFRKMKKLTVSKVEKEIPLLSEGQTFVCENVSASQHFTSLPKTFTENSHHPRK